MHPIIITRTKAGKTKAAPAADIFGCDKFTLVHIRNWRTRTVTVDGETYQVHDEEWLCLTPDGRTMTFAHYDLDCLQDQIGSGWFTLRLAKGGAL